MASRIVDSSDYEVIRKDIFNKFVENSKGKPKGVGQLIEQIKHLNDQDFKFDNYTEKKIKRKNIVVYPIIVYTHAMYGAPGIRDYLNYEFKNRLASISDLKLKTVKNLTMIDLESFYRSVVLNNEFNLKRMIDKYLRVLSNRKKTWEKSKELGDHMNMFPQFETVNSDVFSGNNKPDIAKIMKLIGYKN